MKRVRVSSSAIKSVGYDEQESILEIEFYHGGVHRYLMVPSSLHHGLLQADSVGKFFRAHIENRYPSREVR